ncbi:MAG: aquaporin Z [Ostreibacterium sp.]
MQLYRKLMAECFGTFWLVMGGCGTAVLATNSNLFPNVNVGFFGVAMAFGLTVLTMAYAVGHISGGHFNPAVTCGLWAGGKFKTSEIAPYIISQVIGAIAAAAILAFIAKGNGSELGGFAANGYADLSPGKYSLSAVIVMEFVMTFFFLFIILGATDRLAPAGFAPIAIGLALTLVHLISIPISNTSVNPARSLSQALFADGAYLSQVWVFWVVPIVAGISAGFVYRSFFKSADA